MNDVSDRLRRRAVHLQLEGLNGNECRMPPAYAYFVGGPKDGEGWGISKHLDVIRIPRQVDISYTVLDPVLAEMEAQFLPDTAETGTYRQQAWATVHHQMPWCTKDHDVIEYLWRE